MSAEISAEQLDEIYAFAIQLGKDAGKMLMDAAALRIASAPGQGQQLFEDKDNAVDIVTKTDTGIHIPYAGYPWCFLS
jgi:myo-inositol-1(or 4)-monophosphatase